MQLAALIPPNYQVDTDAAAIVKRNRGGTCAGGFYRSNDTDKIGKLNGMVKIEEDILTYQFDQTYLATTTDESLPSKPLA